MMELLCPAGGREALMAAVRNGADAVYLGGMALNARRGAGNFDADGLQWAADYCHERGARIYVTVNTLVKQAELAVLGGIAAELAQASADAAIVQDIGAAAMLRAMLPNLQIHASTQMAVQGRHGVQFCHNQGYDRVVLAREMTDADIADCAGIGPKLEVFAHGALCVACSGQCLFSSLVGGRSGNRGLCAQPCRLPYKLAAKGAAAAGYLLSPKDLMQLGRLRELESLGVHSIKIEGRLKRPEYVAVVTRIYRAMLDHPHEPTGREIDELKQIFNRGGFTRGYGPGLVDSELMSHDRPNHCGVAVGEVISPGRARLSADIGEWDQIVIADEPAKLSGAAGDTVRVDERVPRGAALVRLADDSQLRAARASYEDSESPSVKIQGWLTMRVGEAMALRVQCGAIDVSCEGATVQRAERRGADERRIRAQLEKTGGTIYEFDSLDLAVDADAFAPVSALNELRRDALNTVRERRITAMRGASSPAIGWIYAPDTVPAVLTGARPMLRVQSADMALLRNALEWGADALIYAPEDITPAALDAAEPIDGIYLALPMACSDAALGVLHNWAWRHRERLSGVIAANVAHFALDWPGALDADFSLNAANNETVGELVRLGARLYAPSLELTAKEIAQLGGDKELIVYGRLPLMQLGHCPLNAQRDGIPHAACRACDGDDAISTARLIDRKGVSFPLRQLKAASGCIARVLNSVPLSLLRHIARLPRAAAWRIILTDESPSTSEAIVRALRCAADGDDPTSQDFWPLIEAMEVTTGHYFRGVE